MSKLHFFEGDPSLTYDEFEDAQNRLEIALRACGRPDDKVVITMLTRWLGSIDIDEEAV